MTARLIAFGLIATLSCAQDAAASRPPRSITLPFADQAKEIARQVLIVVEVFKHADAAAPVGDVLASWRLGLVSQTYVPTERGFAESFSAHVGRLAKANAGKAPGLLIRADAAAPSALILYCMESAAAAGLSRVLLETTGGSPTPRRALECRLPQESDPPDPEGLPDIRLRVALRDHSVVRTFDINPSVFPAGTAGTDQLERLLRTKHGDLSGIWKAEIPVVIEVGPGVQWLHVVDLVSLAHRCGAHRLEFVSVSPDQPPPRPRRIAQPQPERVEASPGEQASRPVPEITVPDATQAVILNDKDAIDVWVFRDAADTMGWRIQVGGRTFSADAAGFRGAERLLAGRSRVKAPAASDRPLVIRADAAAPWLIVGRTIQSAAIARFYKIYFGAAREGAEGRQVLAIWLPVKRSLEVPLDEPEIRVLMSWNSAANKLERLFGQQVVPVSPEGDQRLESLLRSSFEQHQASGKSVSTMIDAGPRVPFKYIVQAVDLARKAGITQVGFGAPAGPK